MKINFIIILILLAHISLAQSPQKILNGFRFTEGPAVDEQGNLYFSDVPEYKIFKYDLSTEKLKLFVDNTGGANGLYFNEEGYIIACAGRARKLISIDPEGNITTLIEEYKGQKLNSPNDLWLDDQGGIYFTDPRYGNTDNLEQDGMHVYYFQPQTGQLSRVINSLERPNGIVGNLDGDKLYVVDEGQRKTFVFDIIAPGKISNKKLFCEGGVDGMSITDQGNLCITTSKAVSIFSPDQTLLQKFNFEVKTTNVVYHQNQLFVTTQSGEVYRIDLDDRI